MEWISDGPETDQEGGEGGTGGRMEGQACVVEMGLKTKVAPTVQGAKAELAVTMLEPAEQETPEAEQAELKTTKVELKVQESTRAEQKTTIVEKTKQAEQRTTAEQKTPMTGAWNITVLSVLDITATLKHRAPRDSLPQWP